MEIFNTFLCKGAKLCLRWTLELAHFIFLDDSWDRFKTGVALSFEVSVLLVLGKDPGRLCQCHNNNDRSSAESTFPYGKMKLGKVPSLIAYFLNFETSHLWQLCAKRLIGTARWASCQMHLLAATLYNDRKIWRKWTGPRQQAIVSEAEGGFQYSEAVTFFLTLNSRLLYAIDFMYARSYCIIKLYIIWKARSLAVLSLIVTCVIGVGAVVVPHFKCSRMSWAYHLYNPNGLILRPSV